MGGGAGEELKAGSSIHLNRKAAIVCSLKCTNIHSSLVRQIWSLAADRSLISVPSGTALSIVDRCHEFTGSQK